MKISKRGIDELIKQPDARGRIAKRFWSKVAIAGEGDCWLWQAKARHKFGYGVFVVATGCVQTSQRVAWALANGPIPPGAHILHSCDVPACCNPRHLRAGDARANVDDKVTRGRQSRTKHDDEMRALIRERRAQNPPVQTETARQSRSEAMRRRWADPAWRARFTELTSGAKNPNFGKRPPDHQIEAVRRGHRKGFSHTEETKQKMRAAALARGSGV